MPEQKRKRGRPTKPAEERATVVYRVRLTESQYEAIKALGGAKWIKGALKKACEG
jgi:hypothetical protein